MPGMGFDMPEFNPQLQYKNPITQSSTLRSDPVQSQSTPLSADNIQLNVSSDDFMKGVDGVDGISAAGSDVGVGNSIQRDRDRKSLFHRDPVPFADEEGVLLQADFEFDEDGNIIELGHGSMSRQNSGFVGEGMDGDEIRTPGRSMKGVIARRPRVDDTRLSGRGGQVCFL